jgi:phasin family protein
MAKATAGFETTQAKVKENVEKAMKTAEELVAFSQGNVEAVVKSGQIWAAGVQDLSKHVAATAQATFDETFSTFKALTSVKSLKDAFDLQASFARSAMEKTMAESGKLTDASFKLTEQALAPITRSSPRRLDPQPDALARPALAFNGMNKARTFVRAFVVWASEPNCRRGGVAAADLDLKIPAGGPVVPLAALPSRRNRHPGTMQGSFIQARASDMLGLRDGAAAVLGWEGTHK